MEILNMIRIDEELEAVTAKFENTLAYARVSYQMYLIEKANEENVGIKALNNEAVREPYFITWLHSLAKHDLYNATIDDNYFDSITHQPDIGQYVYGYHIDGKIEGIIEVVERGNEFYKIYWFYVNKEKHNMGIGQNLFNFIMDKFGDKILELDCRTVNERAIHIYKKYGFKITNANKKFFNGLTVPYYTMERKPGLLESVELFFMDDLFCES